jgi:hypothetical protein
MADSTTKELRCVSGLPRGSAFIGSTFDPERNVAYLIVSHDSFPELTAGALIPEVQVVMEIVLGASAIPPPESEKGARDDG